MSKNCRTAERVQIDLKARWDANFDCREGSVTDISTGGCFILTSGEVSPMELIKVEFLLPTGRWIALWGQVMYYCEEIGFGLRFAGPTTEEQELLASLVEYARDNQLVFS